MQSLDTSTALTQEQAYPIYFKHKLAAAFRVGRHQFANHIYQVNDGETHEDFMREAAGLLDIDKVNLIQLANIQNERPIDFTKVTRGNFSTADANAAELANASERQGELERREAIINQRFAEIGHIDEIQSKLDQALNTIAVLQAGQGTSSASQTMIPDTKPPVVQPVDPGLGGEPEGGPADVKETDAEDKNLNGDTDESKSEETSTPTTKPTGGIRLG